ncbi:MAG: hypothetical protein JWM41_263 [Gemmatimonadetes bacterium]|nr:hypothetical protein [Gemmatimonadota bacterium]
MPPSPSARQFASKGSQRWLQVAVDRAPELLDTPIKSALKLSASTQIEWLSPLRTERFVEYRDSATFTRFNVALPKRSLPDFWPSGGPMWDGLAKTSTSDYLLVEAKAHIPEIVSPRTRASEPAKGRILKSIREVQQDLAPKSVGSVDWTNTFYQYTNRIAHLHFLRQQNGIRAHLVNVYFTNATDVGGPTEQKEWEAAIKVVECYLGLGRHKLGKFSHKIFVDAAPLAALADEAASSQPASAAQVS